MPRYSSLRYWYELGRLLLWVAVSVATRDLAGASAGCNPAEWDEAERGRARCRHHAGDAQPDPDGGTPAAQSRHNLAHRPRRERERRLDPGRERVHPLRR